GGGGKLAGRPVGGGRGAPQATEMSQPWTVISTAPASATMPVVSSRSPTAASCRAGPAAAQVASSLVVCRYRPRTGSSPGGSSPGGSPPGGGPRPTHPEVIA